LKPLDSACYQAVWAIAMNLNRTNRRTINRRRISDDDGPRRVRRQR
jgi:hypothetical protein